MASVASCTAPQQSIIMRKDIVSALVTPCTTSTQRGHGFGRILQDASAARTMLVGHCFSRTHAPQWLGPRWTPLVTFDLPPCKSAGAPAAQPVTVSPDWSASLLRCFWSPDGRLRMVKVCVCVPDHLSCRGPSGSRRCECRCVARVYRVRVMRGHSRPPSSKGDLHPAMRLTGNQNASTNSPRTRTNRADSSN